MKCKCGASIIRYRRINDDAMCDTCFARANKSIKRALKKELDATEDVESPEAACSDEGLPGLP